MNDQSQTGHESPFDVVALAGSAGSHAAITTLLRDLPADFVVPIIVMQHLPPDSAGTAALYRNGTPFAVEWVTAESALAPHTVLICPPRSFVEVLPDGTFVLAPCERGAVDKPFDRLLTSLARSFGHRAIGVVLTGMGADGALGARELKLAGGRVIVQSEASSEYTEMPKAAISAGAADLVVPLADLGQVIGEVASSTPRPKARSELAAIGRVFGERGEVATRAREVDWAETPLGPVISWPEELRLIARTTLESPSAMAVWWGPELIQIYNDAWCDFLGARKHPQALGAPARASWAEVWEQIGPLADRALMRGESAGRQNERLLIDRSDCAEEVFVTLSFSPIRDARGAVVGVQNTAWETTKIVVAERRLQALRALAAQTAGADTQREVCECAARTLASDSADVSFALLYLLDDGRQASLASAAGVATGSAAAPYVLSATDQDAPWPLARVLAEAAASHSGLLLEDLTERFASLSPAPATAEDRVPPQRAFILPLRPTAEKPPIGVLIAALSPHRPFDDDFHSFLDLIVQQINAGLVEAQARQLERERAERLAELDRTKIEFFANVSHEFRTPLTLLLAPLEDLLRQREQLPAPLMEEVEVAASNARRLLRLVNSLLDFSQIETRRQQAHLEPTDLQALTSDIASAFRSAIEAAGLRLRVECDPQLQPVWVDRDMWEKVVSNLLSNAFKFTFEGEIAVELHALSLHAELVVKDTGIGIPADEMPNLFKRFHRIRGARARTVEGSGIGLAIVDDLVKRLGGQLRARSTEHRGTEFTIWIPYKSARIKSASGTEVNSAGAHAFAGQLAEEASRWLINAGETPTEVLDDLLGPPPANAETYQGTILVADDNADMRSYLQRLLSPRWDVELVGDGDAALEAAMRVRPNVILADVMMPGLDGFQLIQRIREAPQLTHTPVILLTARAGEAAAIQGLLAGANDYIAKPFSPRELLARIQAAFERARVEAALRESEERQTFLVKLNDALRPLTDPIASQEVAARILGMHLGVDRCYYAEFDWPNDVLYIHHEYTRTGAVSAIGAHPTSLFNDLLVHSHKGEPLVCDDIMTHPVFGGEAAAYHTRGTDAFILIPLVKQGTMVACMCVTMETARHWPAVEIGLVEETAERTWAAVERAKAEAALRTSEEKFRALFNSMEEAYWLVDVHLDESGHAVDFFYQEENLCGRERTGRPMKGKWLGQEFPRFDRYWLQVADEVLEHGHPQRWERASIPGGWYSYQMFRVDGETNRLGIVSQDINARHEAEAALRASEAQLALELADVQELQRISSSLIQEGNADALYDQILDAARSLMHSEMASIQMLVPERNELFLLAQHGFAPASAMFWEWVNADDTTGCGQVLRYGKAVIIPDVETWDLVAGTENLRQYHLSGIRAVVSSPLIARNGRLVGVISTHWRDVHQPSERELRLLDVLARQAADLIERRMAEEALRQSVQHYHTLFESMDQGFCIIEVLFDQDDQPVDYRFLLVNPAYERQTGLTDVVGRSLSEVVPSHLAYWPQIYGQIVLTGQPQRFERRAEGLDRTYEIYAWRVGEQEQRRVAILFNDITERTSNQGW